MVHIITPLKIKYGWTDDNTMNLLHTHILS